MSSAQDIAEHLDDNGIGTLAGQSGWGIFVGKEPVSPDTCITVYDTGGTMGNPDGEMYDPTIQVRVRTHVYPDGYSKAAQIRDLLILPTSFYSDNWLYTGVWLVSDVAKIGTDDNGRELFTVNFRLMRQPILST